MRHPFHRRRIRILRWVIQLAAFGLLMYGGYGLNSLGLWDEGAQIEPSGGGGVKTVSKRPTATNLSLPATTCIYQRQGLCKGCSLYFVSDAITYRRPMDEVLPWILTLVVLMLVAGRLWCGWICPLGLISDLLTWLRNLVGLGEFRLSRGWRQGLVISKYGLLVAALGVAAAASFEPLADSRLSLVDPFCQVCPSRIFAAFFTFDDVCWTVMHDPITITFTVLGLLAFALFFMGLAVRRLWCRLCPIGGITALFSRSGLAMLVKDSSRCTRCGTCRRVCPLDVERVYAGRGRGPVTSPECHLCLKCVEACPEPDCLQFAWLGFKVSGR